MAALDPTRAPQKTAEVMAAHLIEWSAKLPVKAESVMKLRLPLYDKLFATLWGERASDPDPERPESEQKEIDGDSFRGGETGAAVRGNEAAA